MPQIVLPVLGFLKGIAAVKIVGSLTIGALAGHVLTSVGVSLAAKVLAGKPRQAASAANGDAQTVQTDPNFPRQAMVGQFASAGSYVTHFSWTSEAGKTNDRIAIAFAIADHACEAFLGGWWNEKRITIDPVTGAVAEARVDGVDYLWVRTYLGSWNQAADSVLVAKSGGRWTANDRGRGITYVVIEARQNDTAHPQGLSGLFQFIWEFKGAKLYDRRKDGTQGGSGAHRVNDATTWQYTDNAAAVVDALLRGFSAEDEGDSNLTTRKRDVFFGGGLTIADLPAAETMAALNACDETVAVKAGGTEKRYRAAGMINCGDAPLDVLKDLLAATAGEMLYAPGRWYALPGVARTSERTLTDDDIRVDVEMTYTRETPREERINAIYGKFNDPAQLYRSVELPPRTSASGETRDSGRRAETLDLAFPPSQSQGQRVMEIALRRHQQMQQAVFAVGPRHRDLDGGDCLTISTVDFGFTGRLASTALRTGDEDFLTPVLTLREEAATTYSWNASTDELDRGAPSGVVGTPGAAEAVTGLLVTPYQVAGGDGGRQPGIAIAWDRVQDPAAVGVRVEWREIGGTTVFTRDKSIDPWAATTQALRVEEGIAGVRSYEARAAILYRPERPAVFSAWTGGDATDGTVAGSVNNQAWGATASEQALGTIIGSIPPGCSIGAFGDVVFTKNQNNAGAASSSRIRVQGSALYTDARRTINQTDLIHAFYGATGLTGRFFLVQSATFLNARFGGFHGNWGGGTPTLFLATYNWATGVWTARNGSAGYDFTFLETDTIVGVGFRATTGSFGVDTLQTFISTNTNLPEDGATRSRVFRQQTAPASPNTNDIWVELNGSGVPIAVRSWNGSAWVVGADITLLNIAAGFVGQGPMATDQRELDDIIRGVFSARASIGGFAASNLAKLTLDATTSLTVPAPGLTGNGTARMSTTGSGNSYIGWVLGAGVQGFECSNVRMKVRSSGSTAWRGVLNVYGTFSDGTTVKQLTVTVPKDAAGSAVLSATQWTVVEWDMGLAFGDVYLTAPVTGLRFYLISNTAGGNSIDIDEIAYGTRGASEVELRNISDSADPTAANIAAGITGQGALATASQVDWAAHVTGVGRPADGATRNIITRSLLSSPPASPTVNDIWIVVNGSGVAQSIRAWNGSAWITGGDPTSLNIAAGFTGQGALATLSQVDWAAHVTGVNRPADNATRNIITRSVIGSPPASPTVNDIWVVVDGSGAALSVRAWNGSAWIMGADVTGNNIAAGFTGQQPAATDPDIAPGAGGVFTGAQTTNTTPNGYVALLPSGGVRHELKDAASLGNTRASGVGLVSTFVRPGTITGMVQTMRTAQSGSFRRSSSTGTSWRGWTRDFGEEQLPAFNADLLTSGGAVATDAAYRTDQGVASGYAGQTPWGTYGGSINRLQYINDSGQLDSLSRVTSRDLSLLNGRTADFISYTSGAGGGTVNSLRPGEAGANVTEGRISSGFTGQGGLSLVNYVNFGDSVIRESSGGATATLANFKTNQGVSAGFAGQKDLATRDRPPLQSLPYTAGPNLFPDPNFTEFDSENYAVGAASAFVQTSASDSGPSLKQLRIEAAGSNQNVYSPLIPADEGRVYQIAAWGEINGSGSNAARVLVQWYGSNGATTVGAAVALYDFTSTTPVEKKTLVQCPAGAQFFRLIFRALAGDRAAVFSGVRIHERPGSTLQLPPATVMTSAISRSPANILSSSVVSGAARVSVAAFTLTGDFGSISYNAGSVSGLSFNTLYHIWVSDPTFEGGTKTYSATTTKAARANDPNYIYLGAYYTVTSGGGSGTPDPTDGGYVPPGAQVP